MQIHKTKNRSWLVNGHSSWTASVGRSKQGNTFSLCNELLSELVNFIFISFDTRELISNLYVVSKIFASKNLKRSECVLYSLCLSLVSPDLVSGRTDLLYVDTVFFHCINAREKCCFVRNYT